MNDGYRRNGAFAIHHAIAEIIDAKNRETRSACKLIKTLLELVADPETATTTGYRGCLNTQVCLNNQLVLTSEWARGEFARALNIQVRWGVDLQSAHGTVQNQSLWAR